MKFYNEKGRNRFLSCQANRSPCHEPEETTDRSSLVFARGGVLAEKGVKIPSIFPGTPFDYKKYDFKNIDRVNYSFAQGA
jgi:hypothetical protein